MKDTSGRSSVTPANQWRCTAARVGQRELTLNEAVIWTSMSPCCSGLPCVKLHSSNSPNLFRLLWIWACRALSWSRACVCVWVFATSELVGHVDRTLNVVAALPQIECTLYSEPKFDCHLSKWKKAPKEESRVSRETAPFVQTTEPLHCFIPVSSLFAVIRVLFAEWFPTQHVSLVFHSQIWRIHGRQHPNAKTIRVIQHQINRKPLEFLEPIDNFQKNWIQRPDQNFTKKKLHYIYMSLVWTRIKKKLHYIYMSFVWTKTLKKNSSPPLEFDRPGSGDLLTTCNLLRCRLPCHPYKNRAHKPNWFPKMQSKLAWTESNATL